VLPEISRREYWRVHVGREVGCGGAGGYVEGHRGQHVLGAHVEPCGEAGVVVPGHRDERLARPAHSCHHPVVPTAAVHVRVHRRW